MRAFVAIPLPAPLRESVVAVQALLRAAGADVRWVEPRRLHLTLKFLGNVDEVRLPALTDALRAAVQPHPAFTMTIAGVGAFPSTRSPQVIWVGVSAPPLTALAEAVDRACATVGFSVETRPFAAHLTIGRVRSRRGLAPLVKALRTFLVAGAGSKNLAPPGAAPAPVDHVTLFQSTLSSRGPTYTPLAELRLP